jgi:MFS family permease
LAARRDPLTIVTVSTAQPGDGVAAPSITPVDPLDPVVPLDPAPAAPPAGRTAAFIADRLGGLPRSFWVLWTGSLVNRLGTMVIPFLAFYLSGARGLSVTQVGMVMAVGGAGSLVSQPLGGYFADRFGRRASLCLGMLANAVVMVALGYAAALPLLVVAVFLNGVTVDLYRPASSALVADVVPQSQRPRAYGLLFWAINLGFAVATMLGGMLARHGFLLLFWIDALTCVAFAALIWRLVPEPPRARASEETGGRGGWAEVLRDRVMVAYVLISLSYLLVYQQAYTTLPLAMGRDHLSSSAYGTAIALNGAVIVIVQPLVLPWLTRRDRSHVLAAGMTVVGVGFGLNAVVSSALTYAAAVVVWTLGEIITMSVVMAIIADLAPDHLRGRYQGLNGAAWSVAALVAPLGGAQLLAHGKIVLWPVCAALAIGAAVGQLLLAPAIRRRTIRT